SSGMTGASPRGLGASGFRRSFRVSPWSTLSGVGMGCGPRLPISAPPEETSSGRRTRSARPPTTGTRSGSGRTAGRSRQTLRGLASEPLPALDDHGAVAGVELKHTSGAPQLLGGDQGGTGAGERVVDDVARARRVLERAGHELDGLH